MRRLRQILPVLILFAALPLQAQSRAELKKELRGLEAQAKTADELVDVAAWAKENGLVRDHKRLLEAALDKQPEHPGAMEALGYVKWDGKWMARAKASKLREAALDAEYKAKGLVKVDGLWVAKDEVADAKRGVFHHDDEVVSRDEKLALLEGKVRHPRTGMFIDAADLPKAEQGLFPLPGGKWVPEAEADKYHNSLKHPWVLRTHYATVVTNLPIKTFDQNAENSLKLLVDGAIEFVKPLFAAELPHPAHRPIVGVAATRDQYVAIGNQIGSEGSAYGAFVSDQELPVENQRHYTKRRAAVANWGEKSWGPYYVRHAAGLAYAQALAEHTEVELPLWFVRGVGALPERHATAQLASWFGKQHLRKGGVRDFADWLDGFTISGDLDPDKLSYNIYQAGLAVSFCMRGGDKQTTDAMMKVSEALTTGGGKGAAKSIARLEKVLKSKEEAVQAYFQQLLKQG